MTATHRPSQPLRATQRTERDAANDGGALCQPPSLAPNLALRHMERALAGVVGPRGAAAMLARSQQLCGQAGPTSADLSAVLQRLTAELLGEALAQRLLRCEPERPTPRPGQP